MNLAGFCFLERASLISVRVLNASMIASASVSVPAAAINASTFDLRSSRLSIAFLAAPSSIFDAGLSGATVLMARCS